MEDGGEDMELKYELWKESIFQEKVICEITVLYIISIHKRGICLCYEHRLTTLINKN